MMCEDIIMPTFEDDYDLNSSSNTVLDDYIKSKGINPDNITIRGVSDYARFVFDSNGSGMLYKKTRGITASMGLTLNFAQGLLGIYSIKSSGATSVISYHYWQYKFVFNSFADVLALRVAIAN